MQGTIGLDDSSSGVRREHVIDARLWHVILGMSCCIVSSTAPTSTISTSSLDSIKDLCTPIFLIHRDDYEDSC